LRRDISEAFHMVLLGQLCRMKYLAKVNQFHVHFRVLSVSISVSMFVSVSMLVSVYMSISMLFQFKYGAMIIYGRHGNYIVDSQGFYEVAGKLKGPLI
jgi:hypothetical protein